MEGLRPGDLAPELEWTRGDGTTQVALTDLDGNPVRLADLRGKLVLAQLLGDVVPALPGRDAGPARHGRRRTATAAWRSSGIAVQETTVDDVRAYAERYGLGYPIAFDASADIFHRYRVFALPTQFFIGPDGRIARGRQRAGDRGRRARGPDRGLAAEAPTGQPTAAAPS